MKKIGLFAQSILYVSAGVLHFLHPDTYLGIMPNWLPWPLFLVYLSGMCEVIFGVLLAFRHTRRVGAWLLILLLIAVFPANIQMAINFYQENSRYLWLAMLRLPLQFLLIWWAWLYTDRKYDF